MKTLKTRKGTEKGKLKSTEENEQRKMVLVARFPQDFCGNRSLNPA